MKKAAYLILLCVPVAGAFLAGSWYNQRSVAGRDSAVSRKVSYYACPMHPQYKSNRPGDAPCCGMRLEPVYAGGGPAAENGVATGSPGAVSISVENQQRIGVRVSTVARASGTRTLRLFGRVAPEETRVYRLTAGVDGWIGQAPPVTTGSRVEKGQVLGTFSTVDLFVSAQAYIFALNAMDRLKQSGMQTPLEANPTNSNFHQRIEKLQSLGMSTVQIEEIARTRLIPPSINLVAPAAGFVLARNISPGQRFERGTEWYRIADLNRVWILTDVFTTDVHSLRPGLRARVSLPEQGKAVPAVVSEVLPQFDAASRTLKARLEADNPGYVLRPDMFVDVEMPLTIPPSIAVPSDAVLDSGRSKTVFVDRGEGFFEPRQVETGWRVGDRVQIVKGLEEGERIVTSGNFLLDSESRMKQVSTAIREVAAKDPVCGMHVDAAQAGYTSEQGGRRYYFCSRQCKQGFDANAGRYLKSAAGGTQRSAGGPRS